MSGFDWQGFIRAFITGVGETSLLGGIWEHSISFILGIILLVLLIGSVYVAFSYSKIFLILVSEGFLQEKKEKKYIKKMYNISLFKKHFLSQWCKLLLLFIPIIGFFIFTVILVIAFGWAEAVSAQLAVEALGAFNILLWSFGILSLIILAYFYYRLYFIDFIIADTKDELSVKKIIKTSLNHTYGWKKVGKFSLLVILIFLCIIPFRYVKLENQNKQEPLAKYIKYLELKPEVQTLVQQENTLYIKTLEAQFSGKDYYQLVAQYQTSRMLYILYFIMSFLFGTGLYQMYFLEFYKRKVK